MDHGSILHLPRFGAPLASLRKSYVIVKVQSHAFVGYYHAVICKNPRQRLLACHLGAVRIAW